MKRTIIAASVLALGLAGSGVAMAGPGNSGNNSAYGICKAYEKNAQQAKDNSPVFQDYEAPEDGCESLKPGKGGGN